MWRGIIMILMTYELLIVFSPDSFALWYKVDERSGGITTILARLGIAKPLAGAYHYVD